MDLPFWQQYKLWALRFAQGDWGYSWTRHRPVVEVLKEALPVLTLLGRYFPFLLGGALAVEVVFAWPGMGRVANEALFSKDYPALFAVNLLALILGFTGWRDVARLVRAEVLSLKERAFILKAHAAGLRQSRVLLRHLIPNTYATIASALRVDGESAFGRRKREAVRELSASTQRRPTPARVARDCACVPAGFRRGDELTSALDVLLQSQILALLQELQEGLQLAVLWITHDLAVVAQIAERVAVMRAGKIVETAKTETLFTQPRHEYTQSLLAAMPRIPLSRV